MFAFGTDSGQSEVKYLMGEHYEKIPPAILVKQMKVGNTCCLIRFDVRLMCTFSVSGQRYPCIKRVCLLPKPRFSYNTNESSRHRACVSPVGA